jgi:glycosyltransferase involved in cell wall biosynthesis
MTPRGDIVVLTRIWPSAERPSLGTFVRDRVRGVDGLRVVHPGSRPGPWPLLYARLAWDTLRVRRPRGIEAHVLAPTGLLGWLVARLRRVPLLVYAHGGDARDWERQRQPRRWATRFVATHADRVVTNSEDTARHLRRMGVEPLVAPPGIDLSRFRPSPRPAARGSVLYLGGLTPRKGYAVAARLATTLVGPGLGEVDPAEVPALIAAHDVVLVPSRDEPFGIVAVEAIASGRWVVAAAVGGLREIVVDGVNGSLISDGDYAAALEAVPEYDPVSVARTAERFSLQRWQADLARAWAQLTADERDAGARPSPDAA